MIEAFATGEVEAHYVVHLDIRIWVLDGAAIMTHAIRNAFWSRLDGLNSAEFVRGFFLGDPMHAELALGVIHHAELLFCLLNSNNIHETSGKEHVSPRLAINLDQALHHNHLRLIVVE